MANQPKQQPPNAAGQPNPLSGAGGIFGSLTALVADLRAKDWSKAVTDFIAVLNAVQADINNVPGGGAVMMAAGTPQGGHNADSVAQQLEQFCQQHQARHVQAGAGAFPWQQLIPILLQVLEAIFAKQ